jgi:protein SCO1
MNVSKHNLKLRTRNFKLSGLLLAAACFLPMPLLAEEAGEAPDYYQTLADYKIPDVSVVRQDGKKLLFLKELDDGRPVIMNFVFASCSAICPMLSHIFSKVQNQLTKEGQKFHLVSISIDPENDTPAKLTEYAKKFEAGPNWDFYTGTVQSSIAIQKAFNAYRGDKMNHSSVMVMRSEPGKNWVRLDGFVSPAVVIREFDKLKHE